MFPEGISATLHDVWTQPFAVTCLLTSALSLVLGFFVLWKNAHSKPAQWWATMCFLVAVWSLLNTQTVHSIIKQHHVASTPGSGTTFTVKLPL